MGNYEDDLVFFVRVDIETYLKDRVIFYDCREIKNILSMGFCSVRLRLNDDYMYGLSTCTCS